MTFTACNTDVKSKELKVLDNSKSSEITFILELNTKNNETKWKITKQNEKRNQQTYVHSKNETKRKRNETKQRRVKTPTPGRFTTLAQVPPLVRFVLFVPIRFRFVSNEKAIHRTDRNLPCEPSC